MQRAARECDLLHQQRPIHASKETHSYIKRDLRVHAKSCEETCSCRRPDACAAMYGGSMRTPENQTSPATCPHIDISATALPPPPSPSLRPRQVHMVLECDIEGLRASSSAPTVGLFWFYSTFLLVL